MRGEVPGLRDERRSQPCGVPDGWSSRVRPRRVTSFCWRVDFGAAVLSPWLDTPVLFLGKR